MRGWRGDFPFKASFWLPFGVPFRVPVKVRLRFRLGLRVSFRVSFRASFRVPQGFVEGFAWGLRENGKLCLFVIRSVMGLFRRVQGLGFRGLGLIV